MSNRAPKQISEMASLRASHLAQIEALTVPGRNKREKVMMFAKAAGFSMKNLEDALKLTSWCSVAYAVWSQGGEPQDCIFAFLPRSHGRRCGCPVQEHLISDFPSCGSVSHRWQPTIEQLEEFSRIQIERRFP